MKITIAKLGLGSALWMCAAGSYAHAETGPGLQAADVEIAAPVPLPAPAPAAPADVYGPVEYAAQYAAKPRPINAPRKRPGRFRPLGYAYLDMGATWYDLDDSLFGAETRLGYQWLKPLALGFAPGIEAEGSIGFIDENITVQDPTFGEISADVDIDYRVAVFARLRRPFSDKASAHFRFGYQETQLGVSVGTESASEDFDGFALGSGFEYAFTPKSAFRFDFSFYEVDDGNGAESLSAAYQFRF